jgi:hypothetical protein
MAQLFQRSEITAAIVRYLSQHDKGAQVSYDELTELVGRQITAASHNLLYARRVLQSEHNQVWTCIAPGIAVKRLNDAEIARRQHSWYLPGARNKLAAGARQADVVELSELTVDQQARFATDSIIRELASEALNRRTQRRVEKAARGTSNDLPAFSAVEWMISLSPKRSGAA